MERRLGADAFDEAELLSLHFDRAGRAAETWKYSIEAGRRAREKWANREAVDFYRRALDVARGVKDLDPAEVARVWEDVGESQRLLGEFDDAARAFAAARRLAPKRRPGASRPHVQGRHAAPVVGKVPGRSSLVRARRAPRERSWGRGTANPLPAGIRARLRAVAIAKGNLKIRSGVSTLARCGRLAVDDSKTLAASYLALHISAYATWVT